MVLPQRSLQDEPRQPYILDTRLLARSGYHSAGPDLIFSDAAELERTRYAECRGTRMKLTGSFGGSFYEDITIRFSWQIGLHVTSLTLSSGSLSTTEVARAATVRSLDVSYYAVRRASTAPPQVFALSSPHGWRESVHNADEGTRADLLQVPTAA